MSEAYGPIIFIGRDEELALFVQRLDQPASDEWILQLVGPGGIGKTQLLHRFVKIVEERNKSGQKILITEDFIDLYWTRNQNEIGILKSIADQLAPEAFAPFYKALERYGSLLGQDEPDRGLVMEHEGKVKTQFIETYSQLESDSIVLLFDTTEIVSEAIRQFWSETLPKLKGANEKTFAVVAGRQKDIGLPAEGIVSRSVRAFNAKDVQDYFAEHDIKAPAETLARLTELSEGRPIFIALSLDWLRSGNTLGELVDYMPDEFERAMVARVQKLHFPEDQAILAMAYFHRRFNAGVMAYIFDQTEEVARKSLEAIQHFSFVKYRPRTQEKEESCLLHDEMRDLLNKYVWKSQDPQFEYRQGWAGKIIGYYAQKIDKESNTLEQQYLSLERLYYWLDADLKAAFRYSRELFGRALDTADHNYMDAINREINRVRRRLTSPMQREDRFRQGGLLHYREKREEAMEVLTELLENPASEEVLQGSARAYLAEIYAYTGKPQQTIEMGQGWEKWFEDVVTATTSDDPRFKYLQRDFGWLCNVIGVAYRYQNNLHETEKYYRKALLHFEKASGARAQIATTKTNLGFTYHKLGRDGEALSHCRTALKIREKLGSGDLGFSYNVIGMIYMDQMRPNEAVDYFQRAQKAFRKTGSDWGGALVGVAYGRLMRQWGRYKEQYAGEEPNPKREEYKKAAGMLENAIAVFREQHDDANLSEALNEYGTLLRQQEKWEQAIEYFKESAALSKKIGNQYRYVDNLTDIAILYDYADEKDKALDYAQRAGQLIMGEKINAFNLFAKAQQIVTNVLFERKNYDAAFDAAADACVYIMRLDPEKLGESPAKRETYYDNMVAWLGDKILRLPSQALAERKTQALIARWEREESGGKRLADTSPGFITEMRDLAQNYPLLKIGEEKSDE